MRKGALDLTVKAMLAIFFVLFVLFIGISALGSRTESLGQRADFASQRTEVDVLLSLLGSPCLSVYDNNNKSIFVETQAFLSQQKLDRLHRGNEDLRCTENYNFLSTIVITDVANGKEWEVGITPDENYGRARSTSMPVSIVYDLAETVPPTTNFGRAIFTRYDGPLPTLYGAIKQTCRTRESRTLRLDLDKPVQYSNLSNAVSYGQSRFFAYFGCEVRPFDLDRGNHVLFLRYRTGGVDVV